jgi:hypothetical protein
VLAGFSGVAPEAPAPGRALPVPRVRQAAEHARQPGAPPIASAPRSRASVRMRHVQQAVRHARLPGEAHANPHRREAVRLRAVRLEVRPGQPTAHSQDGQTRRAALRMRILRRHLPYASPPKTPLAAATPRPPTLPPSGELLVTRNAARAHWTVTDCETAHAQIDSCFFIDYKWRHILQLSF